LVFALVLHLLPQNFVNRLISQQLATFQVCRDELFIFNSIGELYDCLQHIQLLPFLGKQKSI